MTLMGMYLLIFVATMWAVRSGQEAMRPAIIAMLMLVSLFAPKLVQYPITGYSNFGNIWYSAALTLVFVSCRRGGWRKTLSIVSNTTQWLVYLFCIVMLMSLTPAVGSNDEVSTVINVIAKGLVPIVVFSWSAFLAASATVIGLITIFSNSTIGDKATWRTIVPAQIGILWAGQIVDSVIFFPGAFWFTPEMPSMMLSGLLWKCIMTVPLAFTIFIPCRDMISARRIPWF